MLAVCQGLSVCWDVMRHCDSGVVPVNCVLRLSQLEGAVTGSSFLLAVYADPVGLRLIGWVLLNEIVLDYECLHFVYAVVYLSHHETVAWDCPEQCWDVLDCVVKQCFPHGTMR